ncbi:MAG: ThuA domain-containing protein [Verrucomicrobia bacterium]|nr:ThuA domain-containing protein [Verrucomicrobiota bacterium]MDA1069603.1 ThuA domain-containing protein [Verrucomicrobiota bacterium]
MKKIQILALLGLCAVAIMTPLCGQDSWEERAEARFTNPPDARGISRGTPSQATVKPKKERRALVFYRSEGFIHTSVPTANLALEEMAKKTKAFSVDLADQYNVFTKKNLEQYDAIIFNNTTHLKFPEESQRQAILDFINSGKGIVGIHAATDNFYEWEAGAAMMGGQFSGHPWTNDGTYAFKVDDPSHPLNAVFRERGFWHSDEIYQYDPGTFQGEENLRILISLDMTKESTAARLSDPKFAKHNAKFKPGLREVPVSWIRTLGKGRLFNTNFGHNESTYAKPVIMKHLLDGIQYALGDLDADSTPSANIKKSKPSLAPNL